MIYSTNSVRQTYRDIMKKICFLFLLIILIVGCGSDDSDLINSAATKPDAGQIDHKSPTIAIDKDWDLFSAETVGPQYGGGPVMISENHVYVIWYGDWSANQKTIEIISDFISNLGNSEWFKINSAYYQEIDENSNKIPDQLFSKTKTLLFVNSKLFLSKSIFVDYTLGKKLTEQNIETIVVSSIFEGKFPLDYNGIYLVITSQDVDQTYKQYYSFCSDYCGWHNFSPFNKGYIKYSFIGDPAKCDYGCSMKEQYLNHNLSFSPNKDWSADGMVSVIAHELAEAVTDPNLNAWKNVYGYENADLCAWTFGKVYATSNGSAANVTVGSQEYLIQQNWILGEDGGYCGLSK